MSVLGLQREALLRTSRCMLAISVGAVAALTATALQQQPSTSAAPKLVLVLSVDQMRYDYLTRFRPLYKGGLKTLIDRAAVFSNAHYRHANSETGPGHSVITSGQNAGYSGIVANEWYDSLLKRQVNVVEDPSVVALGGAGRGASPIHFLGFTIGDMLKKKNVASRAVGVSVKDRSAILMAGPRADAAYWFEVQGGNFVTSTYYMKTAPAWLQAWNAKHAVDAFAGQSWTKSLPEEIYKKYAGQDDMPGEFDLKDTVFPHVYPSPAGSVAYYTAFRRSPMADELLLDVALEAMKAHEIGTRDATDLFAIGFSATDSIGHAFGPDSHEILDQMVRLDRTIGRLFDAIEQRVGMSRTLVVLSADHGVMPLVERLKSQGVDARRARPEDFQKAVAAALESRFPGKAGLVALQLGPDVWLDLPVLERLGLKRSDVEAAVEKGLLNTGLVTSVYTHAQLIGDPPADDPHFAQIRASFFAPRSPHLSGLVREFIYLGSNTYVAGTGHGGPYEDDLHVPVVLMGPGVKPGFYDKAAGPEDIAPTLGLLLGLEYPVQDGARQLREILPN